MTDLSTPTNDGQSTESLITQHIDIWTTAIERKSSAGRGTSNKFSLYGIKKLRELILELAVRGKLVPQDVNDEPASILLERIAAEKAQLVKDGKLKKQKPFPDIGEDEKPFELPNGWAWTCLAELAEIGPRNSSFDDDTEASFVPMPLISTSYKGDHGSETRLWKEIKKGYTHFADGDIGLAKITPCFENSKAAFFSGLINGVGTGTTELHIARPIESTVDPLFILLYLKAPMFLKVGETKMTGTAGQKRVPKDFFAYNPLPFAPLDEQHRIVSKVDELMSLCDALEAQTETSIAAHQTLVETLLNALLQPNTTQSAASLEPAVIGSFADSLEPSLNDSFIDSWQRVAEHFDTLFTTEASIDTLKQTILQLAVMGKLVEQDPNDEPAAKLLQRIAAEKAQLIKDGKIKKQKPLPAITDEEKPFELPNGWVLSRMGEIAQYQKGYAFKSKDYLDNGFMVTKIQNLTENNTQNTVYITPESALEFRQFLLVEGDIVMTTVGSWFSAPMSAVGRSFLINKIFDNSLLNQNAVRIKAHQELYSKYLYLSINSQIFKNYLVKEAQGTANQASITQASIKQFLIGIPPFDEQHRIVTEVDKLMALCDQLKARLSDGQTTQLHLTDAIVERQFN
jgi:type I restriction enzyme S subunit